LVGELRMQTATPYDIVALSEQLRPVEAREISASTGKAPLLPLMESFTRSREAWAVFADGELVCCWGVVPTETEGVGVPWMISTPVIERRKVAFWKLCVRELPELLERWRVLGNAIDMRHQQAVNWAKRLGFRFYETELVNGFAFAPFTISKEKAQWASRLPA
jgi:hypothetical protein